MFTVTELKTYLSAVVPYAYHANEFPTESIDDAAYVKLTGGFRPNEWTNRKQPSFQVIIRGGERSGPATEAKAYGIYDALHQRSDFVVGTQRIIRCTADQSTPLYLGRDDNKRPLYSVNFTMVLLDN